METRFLNGERQQDIEQAGRILREGGLVVIPTETVYGLAANALDGAAVRRIFQAKGRPSDNPLIVHICELSQLAPLVKEVPESAEKLAQAFWPGPLTMILPRSSAVPDETSGGLPTVAVRFPAHPVARAVIAAAGVPLAAPSANLSGRPSPTSFEHVRQDMDGRVEAIVDGGVCGVGMESTVITLAEGVPRVLRPGGVTPEQLRAVLGEVEIDPAVLHRLEEGKRASSPGMKYRHYAPRARVTGVVASPKAYSNYVNRQTGCRALCFEEDVPLLRVPAVAFGSRYDGVAQARRLFAALHELDEEGEEPVFAHVPSRKGIGLAVYNRLIRASGFRLVRPEGPAVLGLTGPSGAGKSTAARLLEREGWAVIDCDRLTRSPDVYDEECLRELRASFGEDAVPGGVLDRSALARKAFASPEGRRELERITFPRILRAIREEGERAVRAGHRVLVLDAPTLFEAGLDRWCGGILAVTAPREERLARICARDGLTREQALLRLSAQPEDSFYTGRADLVLENRNGRNLSEGFSSVTAELREILGVDL